jgi:hypothetical protein
LHFAPSAPAGLLDGHLNDRNSLAGRCVVTVNVRCFDENTAPLPERLGVKALRVELHWYDASYDWGQYDALITEAQRLKWKVLLTLTSPVPKWATSTHKDLITRLDDLAFEEFTTAVGRHYGSQVSLWAIWNEPNVPGWLAPQFNANGTPASPRIYRGLFEAGYAGLTAAGLKSPKVLFGETAPFPRAILRLPHRHRDAKRRAQALVLRQGRPTCEC